MTTTASEDKGLQLAALGLEITLDDDENAAVSPDLMLPSYVDRDPDEREGLAKDVVDPSHPMLTDSKDRDELERVRETLEAETAGQLERDERAQKARAAQAYQEASEQVYHSVTSAEACFSLGVSKRSAFSTTEAFTLPQTPPANLYPLDVKSARPQSHTDTARAHVVSQTSEPEPEAVPAYDSPDAAPEFDFQVEPLLFGKRGWVHWDQSRGYASTSNHQSPHSVLSTSEEQATSPFVTNVTVLASPPSQLPISRHRSTHSIASAHYGAGQLHSMDDVYFHAERFETSHGSSLALASDRLTTAGQSFYGAGIDGALHDRDQDQIFNSVAPTLRSGPAHPGSPNATYSQATRHSASQSQLSVDSVGFRSSLHQLSAARHFETGLRSDSPATSASPVVSALPSHSNALGSSRGQSTPVRQQSLATRMAQPVTQTSPATSTAAFSASPHTSSYFVPYKQLRASPSRSPSASWDQFQRQADISPFAGVTLPASVSPSRPHTASTRARETYTIDSPSDANQPPHERGKKGKSTGGGGTLRRLFGRSSSVASSSSSTRVREQDAPDRANSGRITEGGMDPDGALTWGWT